MRVEFSSKEQQSQRPLGKAGVGSRNEREGLAD